MSSFRAWTNVERGCGRFGQVYGNLTGISVLEVTICPCTSSPRVFQSPLQASVLHKWRKLLTILLIKDIPRGRNAFFSLLAGIDIQEVGKNHESSGGSNITTSLVLLESAGQGDVEQNRPWNTNLSPHL